MLNIGILLYDTVIIHIIILICISLLAVKNCFYFFFSHDNFILYYIIFHHILTYIMNDVESSFIIRVKSFKFYKINLLYDLM